MKNYIVLSLLMLAYLFCLNNNALGGLGIAWHPFPIQLHPGETTDVWFGLQISGSVPITVRQTITEDLASIASLPEGAEYIDYIVTPNVTMGAVTPIVVTIPDDMALGTYTFQSYWRSLYDGDSGTVNMPVEVVPEPTTLLLLGLGGLTIVRKHRA